MAMFGNYAYDEYYDSEDEHGNVKAKRFEGNGKGKGKGEKCSVDYWSLVVFSSDVSSCSFLWRMDVFSFFSLDSELISAECIHYVLKYVLAVYRDGWKSHMEYTYTQEAGVLPPPLPYYNTART